MAKSSEHSRSKGNSLPPTKQFDFTMVDDDFEELQRGFVPTEGTQTRKHVQNSSKTGPAQGTITASQPLNRCQITFSSPTPRCNSSKSSSTMVKSNCLVGGRMLPLLQERLEDLAILCRLTARYQVQVCNPQPAH